MIKTPRFNLWDTVYFAGKPYAVVALIADSSESEYLVTYNLAKEPPAPYYYGSGITKSNVQERDLQTHDEWLATERARVVKEAALLGLKIAACD